MKSWHNMADFDRPDRRKCVNLTSQNSGYHSFQKTIAITRQKSWPTLLCKATLNHWMLLFLCLLNFWICMLVLRCLSKPHPTLLLGHSISDKPENWPLTNFRRAPEHTLPSLSTYQFEVESSLRPKEESVHSTLVNFVRNWPMALGNLPICQSGQNWPIWKGI